MLKIKCPKCGEEIELGKDAYNTLLNEIETEELDKKVKERTDSIEKVLKAKYDLEINKAKNSQDVLVAELQNQIKLLNEKLANSSKDIEVAVSKAVESLKNDLNAKGLEVEHLKGQLNSALKDSDIAVQKLKEQFEFQLKAKDEQIEQYKNFRVGDSTKDIGESLEQYCHDAFDEIRAVSYPNAYFEKDNTVVEGTKGDFIFRDYSDDDNENEMVSIMFEKKKQKEDGDTKNESHFKKLDSDRKKQNCAVVDAGAPAGSVKTQRLGEFKKTVQEWENEAAYICKEQANGGDRK